jgi:hypothetical protein
MAGAIPTGVSVGRLDDGPELDIVVGNFASNDISVFLGSGDGGFGTATAYATGHASIATAFADFDLDAHADLAVASQYDNEVWLLLGDGSGALEHAASVAVGAEPRDVESADLDGNGIPDIVSADRNADSLSVVFGEQP